MKWLRLIPCLYLALAGCSGGGGGSVDTTTDSTAPTVLDVPVLVTDAPADFLTFLISLEKVQAVQADGDLGDNLIEEAIEIDLMDHDETYKLLGSFSIPSDATGIQVEIGNSITAEDLEENAATVLVGATTASSDLPEGWAGEPLAIEFPIDEETVEDNGDGTSTYTPAVNLVSGEASYDLSDLYARVVAKDTPNQSFQIAIKDQEGEKEYGTMIVKVDAETILIGPDGEEFGSMADFFFALEGGNLVEIEGDLEDEDTLLAGSVMIESPLIIAKIRGRVEDIDLVAGTLDLRIRRIPKGKPTVLPVLASLGNPRVITLALEDTSHVFLVGRGGGKVGMDGLKEGQYVTARFTSFVAPEPILTRAVIIHRGGIPFWGQITDVSASPASVEVLLHKRHPLVKKGILDQQVTVELDSPVLKIFLGIPWVFPLDAADLMTGHHVKVRGRLSGSAVDTIIAWGVRVRAGLLRGTVLGENSQAGTYDVSYNRILRPFGGSTNNPVQVDLHNPSIKLGRFGRPLTENQFFNRMDVGDRVLVRGIGTASGDIVAYLSRIF